MIFKNIDILVDNERTKKCQNVVVEDGFIKNIENNVIENYNGYVYDGKGKILIPGFVNTHCHSPMTLLRGLGTDLTLQQWLEKAILPVEKNMTSEAAYWGCKLAILEMLRCGVTSFSDMYFFGEERVKAVIDSGIKSNICVHIDSFDENINLYSTEAFKEAKYLYENYNGAENGKIIIDMCIHGEYTSNIPTVRAMAEYSKEVGAGIQIHLSETKKETDECIARHKKTPAEYFLDMGIFDCNTTAAHCVYLTENDMDILKDKGVSVSHCPISNLKLGSGIAPISNMIDRGINVSVGTDGCASNDNLNILEDIKFAALLQKGLYKDPSLITALYAIKMATENGAKAQNRVDTGIISEGKKADLTVIDYNSINMLPCNDEITSIVYSSTINDVVLTMVDGKILYNKGEFTTLDEEEILFNFKRCINR